MIDIVVVVDLYSASHRASNMLIVPLRCKKMSFQRRSEAVCAPSRVPEWVWKRVPFHQTRNRESPTTKCATTVSWHRQLVTVGRSKTLAAWEIYKRPMYACIRYGTEEPYSADTSELWLRVYTGHVVECAANVAQGEAVGTNTIELPGFT